MLQQQKIFQLGQVLDVGGVDKIRGKEIADYAATKDASAVVFLTRQGTASSGGSSGPGPEEMFLHSVRLPPGEHHSLRWFSSNERVPKCLAFNREEDFVMVATEKGEIFIVPTTALVPGQQNKG